MEKLDERTSKKVEVQKLISAHVENSTSLHDYFIFSFPTSGSWKVYPNWLAVKHVGSKHVLILHFR